MSYLDNPIRLQEVRSFYLERLLKPKLTSERADIVTRSYARTEGSHPITRRAQALKDILAEMSIYIKPWELLAGNLGPEPVSAPVFPEGGADFILEEMDSYGTRPGDKFEVSEETKKELRRILPLWKGKTLKEYGLSLMPEGPVRMREAGVFSAENMLTCGTGHFLPDYTKVLEQGFRGISEQAKAALMTLDLSREEGYEKRIFYEAVLTICAAVRDFSLRYAELADSMAAEEKEEERRRELKKIAEVCRRVPWGARRRFRRSRPEPLVHPPGLLYRLQRLRRNPGTLRFLSVSLVSIKYCFRRDRQGRSAGSSCKSLFQDKRHPEALQQQRRPELRRLSRGTAGPAGRNQRRRRGRYQRTELPLSGGGEKGKTLSAGYRFSVDRKDRSRILPGGNGTCGKQTQSPSFSTTMWVPPCTARRDYRKRLPKRTGPLSAASNTESRVKPGPGPTPPCSTWQNALNWPLTTG